MRIYLVGPIGVGKSYILERVRELLPKVPVHEDPIMKMNLHRIKDPLKAQAAIEASLFTRDVQSNRGVFDTSLHMAGEVFSLLSVFDKDTNDATKRSPLTPERLRNVRRYYLSNLSDIHDGDFHIIIDREWDQIREQIKKRGREYEVGNKSIKKINEKLVRNLEIRLKLKGEKYQTIKLVGNDVSPVIGLIKELVKNGKSS